MTRVNDGNTIHPSPRLATFELRSLSSRSSAALAPMKPRCLLVLLAALPLAAGFASTGGAYGLTRSTPAVQMGVRDQLKKVPLVKRLFRKKEVKVEVSTAPIGEALGAAGSAAGTVLLTTLFGESKSDREAREAEVLGARRRAQARRRVDRPREAQVVEGRRMGGHGCQEEVRRRAGARRASRHEIS